MQNWWLATLEHFGLVTREQAEHIAAEIKTSIHKDKYTEAFEDLESILGKARGNHKTLFSGLEDKLYELESKVSDLAQELETVKAAKTERPIAKAAKT